MKKPNKNINNRAIAIVRVSTVEQSTEDTGTLSPTRSPSVNIPREIICPWSRT